MRTGRLFWGASLGMALLLNSYGLRAQESIGPPKSGKGLPGGGPPAGLPTTDGGHEGPAMHDSHHEEHEEHEEHEAEEEEGEEAHGGGLIADFDFLLVRPRRRPHDFAILDPAA